MSDKIIVSYEVQVAQAQKSLVGLENEMRAVETASKKSSGSVAADNKKVADSFDNTTQKTKGLTKELTDSSKKVNTFSDSIKGVAANLAAVFTVGAAINFGKQVIEITSQFQKLEAVLTNTLGSQSEAQKALKLIQDFAATTNFSVLELTDGFLKLANSGFVPTRKEMTKLADLANSTGKSFGQLVEAILDANTFQFERLKEFGIKAQQTGDKIQFTFKGITTEVGKSAASVQAYLLSLGDLQGVAGSTAAISATLGGQISNLGDSYDALLLSIGKNSNEGVSGAISLLSTTISEGTKAVQGYDSVFTPLSILLKSAVEPFTRLAKSFFDLFEGVTGTVTATDGLKVFFTVLEKSTKIALVPLKIFVLGITTAVDAVNLLKNALKGDFSIGDLNKLKADANKFVEIVTLSDGKVELLKQESASEDLKRTEKTEQAKTTIVTKAEIERAKALARLRQILADEARGRELQEFISINNEIRAAQDKNDNDLRASLIENSDAVIDSKKDEVNQLITIDEQYLEDKEKKEKEHQNNLNRIRETGFQVADELLSGFADISAQKKQMELDEELKNSQIKSDSQTASLQKQLDAGIITEEQFAARKAVIDQKQSDKEAEIKKKQFQADKMAALIQVAIDTAIAVAKSFAQLGPIGGALGAALAAAMGIAQAAVISAQPMPKFRKGAINIKGPGTGTSDSIPAMISKGESVITAEATRDNFGLLKAIHEGTSNDYINKNFISPAISKMEAENNRAAKARRDKKSSQLMALVNNGMDLSNTERLLKKNGTVKVSNIGDLAKEMSKQSYYNSLK